MVHEKMVIEPLFYDGNFEKPKSPKNLIIAQLNVHEACSLNLLWHSRLPKIHWSNVVRNRYYMCYCAKYKGVYVACAIWSSPVNQSYNIEKTLELRRMAISELCPQNTATYMLGKMVKDIKKQFPKVVDLISYQDTEVHLGTIYKASNWFIDGETKFRDWGKTRERSKVQSAADKIRWKYIIKR